MLQLVDEVTVKMSPFFQVCIPGAAYGRKEQDDSQEYAITQAQMH
jgi:hypothetical protein